MSDARKGDRTRIGKLDDFPEHKGTRVGVDGKEVAVFNIDGALYGVQNSCPHKYMPLHIIGEKRYVSQRLVEGGYYDQNADSCDDIDIRGRINREDRSIQCPYHQLEFDLESGKEPVTDRRIQTYDIEVDDENTVWIEL